MNILFLSQILPFPLTSGAKVRAYYMLRYLAQRHQVTLVSFTRQDDSPEDIGHLRQYCHSVHTVQMKRSAIKNFASFLESILSGVPAVIIRDRNKEMTRLLEKLVNSYQFDVIHADQTSMAYYASRAQGQAKTWVQPKILLDQHNALFNVVNRQADYERGVWKWMWHRENRLLKIYERRLCEEFDHVLTVTSEDKTLLLNLFAESEKQRIDDKIWPLPICIDPDQGPIHKAGGRNAQIVHVGTMFWPPNAEAVTWFSKEVLPMIIEKVPDIMFVVAGKDPPRAVQNITQDPQLRGHIEVSGYVRDLRDLISASSVFVVPLRAGGGMRVKILDAWSWGIPVVSTSIGAEGISMEPENNILIADDPEDFASQVIRAINDADLARKLSKNGRKWVNERYHWQKTYRQVDQVYTRLNRMGPDDDPHSASKDV